MEPKLSYNFCFEDLYLREGLSRVDECFLDYLKSVDKGLHERLINARMDEQNEEESMPIFIMGIAAKAEEFIANLFNISFELEELKDKHHKYVYHPKHHNKKDYENLIPVNISEIYGVSYIKYQKDVVSRNSSTSPPFPAFENTLHNTNYCHGCHKYTDASCSHGLKLKKTGEFKQNPLGIPLSGCPLGEKISEMNTLKKDAYPIAALIVASEANPMLAGTGYHICSDCIMSCMYQRQDPVNIPLIETRTLHDVLELPWGFEIYSLLTRWNPVNLSNPIPKPETGKKVMVVGTGPAGYTASHHLLNEGHSVTAIEGRDVTSLDIPFAPIYDIKQYFKNPATIESTGFGGTTETGITSARWNKNHLLLIRLLLERRKNFTLKGCTEFGKGVTPDAAFKEGFHHIAVATGCMKSGMLDIEGADADGVIGALGFLRSVNANNAKNIKLAAPVLVIGSGLTAVDAATEALALTGEDTYIVYRRRLIDSPAYKTNYFELEAAFKEGIRFIEQARPVAILKDCDGKCKALRVEMEDGVCDIPAGTVIMSIGAESTAGDLSQKFPDVFEKKNGYLKLLNEQGQEVDLQKTYKPDEVHVLTHIREDGKSISFLGDLHPSFEGNVARSMASAKHATPIITRMVMKVRPEE